MLDLFYSWFVDLGIPPQFATWTARACIGIWVLLLSILADFIVKRFALKTLKYIIAKTRTTWDDAIVQHKVLDRLAHLAPALIIYNLAHWPFTDLPTHIQASYTAPVLHAVLIFVVLIGILVINAFLNATLDIINRYEMARKIPAKGFAQVIKLITAFIGGILIFSILLNKSPIFFLSGLGAMTAVILLIFKDTILGLVAGIQLSANKMVAVGDWIEMPKYGADGDVIDVALTIVKVQNWDKTVTTIPAYALISDSFKNWHGMQESGGRRIKRHINIDMQTIRFCTEDMLARFSKIKYIAEYIQHKKDELSQYNTEQAIDDSNLVNGRRMTNVGTFRAYIIAYLKNHPKIHQDMTFLVRQLAPTEHGLPIEVYVFSNDIVWAHYEAIQADIFDHILAVIPEFDLRVFQDPSGNDFRALNK
ncbi:MAG: mechanosensitive ion channel family protein [Candidatus Latescibacteria bacterium]|jgi:miniconductance mechanosensitive channel|nr:mechanosensitive ion channel family protein [Candidatus Latescibacterota bacterium]MBT5830301.1 mechanosensitive ion channel family protein [Candidatus Latescibacterota bacterium]